MLAMPAIAAVACTPLRFEKRYPLHLFSGIVDFCQFPGDTLDISLR